MNGSKAGASARETDPGARGPGGMYVEESGTPGSPAIVFLHGGGQSSREWRGHMERLSGLHCLAPDLPGFGRSSRLPSASPGEIADLIAELIETRVPARRASVVGVSWAGAVVHALLDRHPDRVDRAVLDGSPMFRYIAPRGSKFLAYVFLTALSPFMHTRPVVALFHGTHDPADLRAASRRAILRAVWVKTSAATGSASPVLLVAGEKEGYVRQADAALATLMPHAEAWFAPGLGHCWQRVAPDLHIRMVEAWVSGQELPSELRREPPPSPEAVERLRRMATENWYVTHRRRIVWDVRFTFRHYRKVLTEAYGRDAAQAIVRDTLQGFEALLPDLPYLGGDENPNTRDLYMAAAWLAMYRSLKARGASVEEAARLIYLGAERYAGSVPMRWLLRWQGRSMLGRQSIERMKRMVERSQRRRYADDWVYEFVEGDGREFEVGMDCTECAITKYLAREGAPELAPYLCWIDYPMFAAAHLRLDRTETLAQGGRRCDFRMSRGTPVHVEPEFLRV